MSIFGKAVKGFGMLKKSNSAKKTFLAKRKVFGNAATKQELSGAIKSAKRNIKQLNERVKKIMDKDKYDKNFKIGQRKAQEQIAESKALKKPYSNSSVNKYLSKEYKKDKPHG
tara:strand:+ start:432 stop:770 length:339 start_codon:yes stop_codon:yes gene_type:complete